VLEEILPEHCPGGKNEQSVDFHSVNRPARSCSNKSNSSVVAFGDGYADDGKCYTFWQESVAQGVTNSEELKNWDGNWEHRSTNCPMAVEVLAENLKVSLKNYAVCAALTGKGNINFDMPNLNETGLSDQIDKFEADLNGQKADPEALYLITTGSSDAYASIFYNQFEQFQGLTADQVSADLAAAITRLAKLGAHRRMNIYIGMTSA
jgi:phospholipase/lecithinase/hemolysin